MKSRARQAERWLLYEIPAAADPTERGLVALAKGIFDWSEISLGLRRLKKAGMARKQEQMWNPHRPNHGNGWELTDEGRALLAGRLAKQAQYEYEQYVEGS